MKGSEKLVFWVMLIPGAFIAMVLENMLGWSKELALSIQVLLSIIQTLGFILFIRNMARK
jgi:uncharacterized membrane protein